MNKNVLIIDDSAFILSVVEKALRKGIPNLTIYTAASFSEAEAILGTVFFHAAVVDVVLPDAPDGDAIDLTLSHEIPTIVLTGNSSSELQRLILDKNIIDFILKNNSSNISYVVFAIKRILENYSTNVLVVDDAKSMRNLVSKLLRKLHLNVFEAEDPVQALALMEEQDCKFSMVITDYEMPNMDGLEFTLRLRQNYRKDILSIIALSAADVPGLSAKFLRHGASDFLQKPFDQEDLFVRINSNLELLDMFEYEREMSIKDRATLLHSRQYLYERFPYVVQTIDKNNTLLGFALIDIDNLRDINDEYGFDAGDAVIMRLAEHLHECSMPDAIISRFSGQVFAILTEVEEEEFFMRSLENIRHIVEHEKLEYKKSIISTTVSIGAYCGAKESSQEVTYWAEDYVRMAKSHGRNCIKHSPLRKLEEGVDVDALQQT